jgi:uncharacterized SAM-binding protein YcdF (DUF218 family)
MVGLAVLTFAVTYSFDSIDLEPISDWDISPPADCAVVLTGGVGRVREGISLLGRGMIKKLIISGVNPNVELKSLYPPWMVPGDIDEKDVILERRSTTTYGNAQQTLAMVEALHCHELVIITSQVHMPRAYRTFKGSFPDEFPLRKHTLAAGKAESSFWDLCLEVIKNIFYALWAY